MFRDPLFRVFGADGVGVVDVAEDGLGADVDHRLDAGEGRQRGDEDLIARFESLRDVQEVHGGGPRGAEDDVRDAEVGGELFLELFALGAEDVVAALDDVEDAAIDQLAVIDARERDFACHGGSLRVRPCTAALRGFVL
jgi:hypothetical protein